MTHHGERGLPPRLRTILVATDLSTEAGLAVASAARLALPGRCALHVLYCVPNLDSETHPDGSVPHSAARGGPGEGLGSDGTLGRSTHGARLVRHIEDAGISASDVHLHLLSGSANRAIAEVAEKIDADLTVLGRHRPRRPLDGLIGSTADRVIRTASRPCLAANREVERRPRRLMVATDLSPHADQALWVATSWAIHWAGAATADAGDAHAPAMQIDLVRIADYARPGYRPEAGAEGLAARAAEVSRSAGPDVEVTFRTVSYPLAPEGIWKVAEDLKPDLVFMGSHGHGPVLRTLIGSVASEVIRTLPLAVVVVPPVPD